MKIEKEELLLLIIIIKGKKGGANVKGAIVVREKVSKEMELNIRFKKERRRINV